MQNAKLAANGLTPTINQHGVLYGIAPKVWMESCGAGMESARSAVLNGWSIVLLTRGYIYDKMNMLWGFLVALSYEDGKI